jgi:hypothetical protein
VALACNTSPVAVTTSTARRLSTAMPCLPMSHPRPPPSVSPPTPVLEMMPPVLARTVELGLAVVVAPGRATLGARPARARVDVHRTHGGQVDHEAAVAHRVAGDIVSAAPDGQLEAALAAEAHGRLHVGGAMAPEPPWPGGDRSAVVDTPGVLVCGVRRQEDRPGELRAKGFARMSFSGHRDTPCLIEARV